MTLKLAQMIHTTQLRPDAAAATALNDFRLMSDQHSTWSFKWRLFWYFKKDMGKQFLMGIECFSSFGPPIFLRLILTYLSDRSSYSQEAAIFYALGMAATNVLTAVLMNRVLLTGRQMSVKLRAVLSGELFAKTLRRQESPSKQGEDVAGETSSSGKLVTLVSTDVLQCAEVFAYLYTLFPRFFIVSMFESSCSLCHLTGLLVTIGVYLLFQTIGLAALAGLLVLVAQIPLMGAPVLFTS